jgi:hypothetical protein
MVEFNFLRGYEVNEEVMIEEFSVKDLVYAFEGTPLRLTRKDLFRGENGEGFQ